MTKFKIENMCMIEDTNDNVLVEERKKRLEGGSFSWWKSRK